MNWHSLFKISGILWIIWGIVHMFAGVMTMHFVLSEDVAAAVGGIADAVDPALLAGEYPQALGAIIGQHGFNLFWIGGFTLIGGGYVWKGSRLGVYMSAIVGGLTDLGYFLFMDLGGYANFMPGTVMTLVSLSAVVLSLLAVYKTAGQNQTA